MSRLNGSLLGHLRPAFLRVKSFAKSIKAGHLKSWMIQSFNRLILVGSLLFFLVALGSGYFYMFPASQPAIERYNNQEPIWTFGNTNYGNLTTGCNVFNGKWVPDETYPLYNASECPFAERGFDCLTNGRRDRGYLKWRWKPRNCDIPRFNVHLILEKLRGKRVVFVGDSLGRTQWESMICLLMTGVEDKKTVYEINGNKITKQIRHLAVRFGSFNFTVEFYRSVFLVQPGVVPKRAPKRVKWTLKLDQLDDINREWIDSDVLIFNAGHWWTPTKLFEIQGLVFPDRWQGKAWNVN